MNQISLNKICTFLFRINIFIFSYLLYLLQLIFIVFNLKGISRRLFCSSSYFASLSLGISYKFDKEIKKYFKREGIHISNHDNPLDIFFVQNIFKLPTITTVHSHLKNFLPFIDISLKNFGHYTFDHLNMNERKAAYFFLNKICRRKESIIIFPSGSIYTSINQRFSKSVLNLSSKYNLEIIAWKFFYENCAKSKLDYDKKIFPFILKRFYSEKIVIQIEKVKVFDFKKYRKLEDFYSALTNFYLPNNA